MAGLNKLGVAQAKNETRAGRYSDGGGLYLHIGKTSKKAGAKAIGKSWVFVWTRNKLKREMGLGAYRFVSLALARELAAKYREDVYRGLDPIYERKKLSVFI